MLTALTDDLHTAWHESTFLGLKFGMRVTILRLPDGGLWVHSPIPLSAELRAAVDALGPVRHLVAPNLLHHVSMPEWAAAYPNAVVHAPAGLTKKQKTLTIHRPFDGTADPAWGDVLRPIPLPGMPSFDETCFVHSASRTLISADIVLAIPPELKHWWTQTYLRLAGIHGQTVGCSLVHKFDAKDKPALRRGIDAVLDEDFDRLIVSHSGVVQAPDVRDQLRDAWSWLP
ncbi:MAG: DUF4336 domain-containing protein [Deltaproteobacteria bacterium]|nr:DUF4336 domain-containing protein [Deltaproteobacteria bacterium]